MRAVVVVVPGSGGLEDPYFDPELAQQHYDPSHRGGLTKQLVEAGFGVAYYNQRGYHDLTRCIAYGEGVSRAQQFVDNCVDQGIRAKVDLDVITSDTESVLAEVSKDPTLFHVPVVVLAFSEGMYHAARASVQHHLKVTGIVSVGGPFDSLRDTMRYQVTHEAFLAAVNRGFERCPSDVLSIQQTLQCAGLPEWPIWSDGIRVAMNSAVVQRVSIARQRAFWSEQHQKLAHALQTNGEGTLDGNFEGVHIARNWSVDYYRQFMSASITPLNMLQGFRGRVDYLFGAFDQLVRIPTASEFGREAAKQKIDATMRVVPGVNHALADETGMPTHDALAAIVSAIQHVLLPSPR